MGPTGADRPGPSTATLDWSVFDDPGRASYLRSIDEAEAARSPAIRRLVRLASVLTRSECSQLSLVGGTQYVPAAHGVGCGLDEARLGRRETICAVTVALGRPLVIDDASTHSWVRSLPAVRDGRVGAYLGVPIVAHDGTCPGAVCAFDAKPRTWTDTEIEGLEHLARLLGRELDLLSTVGDALDDVDALHHIVYDVAVGTREVASPAVHTRWRPGADGRPAGDWFDGEELDDGETIGFVLGDVRGHRLGPTKAASRLRTAARSLLETGHGAEEVVRRCEALLTATEASAELAAIAGRFHRPTRTLDLALTHHLPPVLIAAGDVDFVGPIDASGPVAAATVAVPDDADAKLIVFSDTMVDVRGRWADRRLDVALDAFRRLIRSVMATSNDPEVAADRLSTLRSPAAGGGPDLATTVMVVDLAS